LVKLHCERNKARRIAVMQTAVWDSSRELTFERSQEASSRMEGRVNQVQESKGEMIRVAAISPDDFFFSDGRGEPPNLIKIDVEAGEFEVLSEARRLLGEFRPRILCKIHSREMVMPRATSGPRRIKSLHLISPHGLTPSVKPSNETPVEGS